MACHHMMTTRLNQKSRVNNGGGLQQHAACSSSSVSEQQRSPQRKLKDSSEKQPDLYARESTRSDVPDTTSSQGLGSLSEVRLSKKMNFTLQIETCDEVHNHFNTIINILEELYELGLLNGIN